MSNPSQRGRMSRPPAVPCGGAPQQPAEKNVPNAAPPRGVQTPAGSHPEEPDQEPAGNQGQQTNRQPRIVAMSGGHLVQSLVTDLCDSLCANLGIPCTAMPDVLRRIADEWDQNPEG